MSVYVGNLSYDVSQEDLKHVFEEYGSVEQLPKLEGKKMIMLINPKKK